MTKREILNNLPTSEEEIHRLETIKLMTDFPNQLEEVNRQSANLIAEQLLKVVIDVQSQFAESLTEPAQRMAELSLDLEAKIETIISLLRALRNQLDSNQVEAQDAAKTAKLEKTRSDLQRKKDQTDLETKLDKLTSQLSVQERSIHSQANLHWLSLGVLTILSAGLLMKVLHG